MSTVTFRPVAPIRAEGVAAKIASIRNLELPELFEQIAAQPRIPELLWFIEWHSLQDGGLVKWCAEFIGKHADRIGTPTMHTARVVGGKYSLENTRQILSEVKARSVDFGSFYFRDQFRRPYDCSLILDDDRRQLANERRAELEAQIKTLSHADLLSGCQKAAAIDLPHHLQSLCTDTDQDFSGVWYFRDLIGALIAAMDDHARATRNGLAQTEVVEKVYDALDYCLSVRKMVHIAGLPRFGKSESLTAWCNARPGIARVVVVPPSNSEGELYIAVAEALGIDAGAAAKLSDLRTRIEYVLKHSRLMLCIDESHYLFPTKFTKNTTPARLNWVRSILDKRTPVALCFTPQSFNQARRSFTQATGYAVEQFSGRVVRTVTLPDVLSKKDLFAVAKHHFPEFDNDFLLIVVSAARRCEGYLQAVEAIAGLARHYATKRGSAKISAADLKLAISEIAPANADGDSSRSTAKENSEPSEPLRLAKKPPEKIISLQPAELSTSAPRGACVQLTPDRAAELEQAEA